MTIIVGSSAPAQQIEELKKIETQQHHKEESLKEEENVKTDQMILEDAVFK